MVGGRKQREQRKEDVCVGETKQKAGVETLREGMRKEMKPGMWREMEEEF